MFEPIIGERQCSRCAQCRPAHEFIAKSRVCIACRRAYSREHYRRKYAHPRKVVEIAPEVVAVVRRHFPEGGSYACLKRLPAGWTAARVQRVAKKYGIHYIGPPEESRACERGWAVPAQTLPEQLDCVRLRRWRYPVEAGALAWRLA